MITSVDFRNYRSFVQGSANLAPFTLVIGPNGSGKSNFLRLIDEAGQLRKGDRQSAKAVNLLGQRHLNHLSEPQTMVFKLDDGGGVTIAKGEPASSAFEEGFIRLYSLDPSTIGRSEQLQDQAAVQPDGSQAVSVLDALKNGDREDLFDRIEALLRQYIPSIEKLSFFIPKKGHKQLQVRETGITSPFPVSELSEGTRLLLLILTIVHQERAPKVILLEDLDRALHARLFQQVVEMLRSVTREKGVQIIATAHNPYLVDEFLDHEDAVLLVEKENGESTITSLADRLETGESKEGALGSLWFGGFVGAVPTL